MDPITATAASGLRARMESLDLLANNMANSSTVGYKADREFYSLYVAPEAEDSDSPGTMPLIEKPWTDLSQSLLTSTGNRLDVALKGKGYFSVSGPQGTLYTRNGVFHLAADGTLVTDDAYPVRSTTGGSLIAQGLDPIDIASDGTISQNGQAIGQLDVADFTGEWAFAKQGNNYFRVVDPSTKPTASPGASVEQGSLEASNTGAAESAVRLIDIMRQFEMLQKAVLIGNDMNKQAVEQVAKVGS